MACRAAAALTCSVRAETGEVGLKRQWRVLPGGPARSVELSSLLARSKAVEVLMGRGVIREAYCA